MDIHLIGCLIVCRTFPRDHDPVEVNVHDIDATKVSTRKHSVKGILAKGEGEERENKPNEQQRNGRQTKETKQKRMGREEKEKKRKGGSTCMADVSKHTVLCSCCKS